MDENSASQNYSRDLGGGLRLRWSRAEDAERIAHLVGMVFRQSEDAPPDAHLTTLVYQLMRGDHPLMTPNDYGLVEDTQREGCPVVACICLWRQRWVYEGIPFDIGRPEIVATDPAYRHRGLIRSLFAMIHARSEAEGYLAQAITGIPYFYRQFGYEYALDLHGGRTVYSSVIATLPTDAAQLYTLREASVDDIPAIMDFYRLHCQHGIVWTDVPENYWRYDIADWPVYSERERLFRLLMLIDEQGEAQGYVSFEPRRYRRTLRVYSLGLRAGITWRTVIPAFLRGLQAYAEKMPVAGSNTEPLLGITFAFGREHPIYDILGDALASRFEKPYAWYVRIPNMLAFLQRIAPVLNQRLAVSQMAGYSGELKIDCYRGGICMNFEQGRLMTVEEWPIPIYGNNAQAGFPVQIFIQLVLGHRNLDELRYAFPDVWWANDEIKLLLNTLFPAKPSAPLPL